MLITFFEGNKLIGNDKATLMIIKQIFVNKSGRSKTKLLLFYI